MLAMLLARLHNCRRHIGLSVRDSCLNVSDINSAPFKPPPCNNSAGQQYYKGHPQGPRVPSPVRPRSDPNIMDNSLRKFDIAGTRWVRPRV